MSMVQAAKNKESGQIASDSSPHNRFERYERQIRFRPIGEEGQERLSQKRVLIVGMGALGTISASHLVRAGIGGVRIADRDYVEWSNLHRQMLYDEDDAREALPKAIAAERKLKQINSEVEIEAIVADVTPQNARSLVQGIDLVLDGTDNFETRFLLNDLCFSARIPYIYGGIVGSRAMCAGFVPGETMCLRCFISPPEGEVETCESEGIIGPVPGITASLQAAEALKYLTGSPQAMKRSVTYIDLWMNSFKELAFGEPSPHCPVCAKGEYPALREYEQQGVHAVKMCGRNTVQLKHPAALDLDDMAARMEPQLNIYRNPFLLKVFPDNELTIVLFADGRLLVQGTEDIARAEAAYSRYIAPYC